ncbi:uncharacterized protein [Primulina huaijiensis]|uniref:uncharacterized protein isoform X1 n=1 Tax=Primulina huaijiensis TaxID=1492673 RepID=UPI003CC6E3D8
MRSRKVKEKLLEKGTQIGESFGICSGKAKPFCSESEKRKKMKKKMPMESKKSKNSNSLKSKNKKVLSNDSKKTRSIARKRTRYSDIYDDVEAKFSVMERAERVLTHLENGLPYFVKCMLPSNVAHGFWLHLPKKFCTLYFPNRDSTICLVDEWGNEYKTSYLLERHGLSAGWRGFSISHRLLKGDILIFHLIEPCKLKVHIVRVNRSEVVSAALCLMNLDASRRGTDDSEELVKKNNKKRKKTEYVEPFLLDISAPTENCEVKNKPCSNFESNSDDFSTKIIQGSSITSQLKANDLCYSETLMLHDQPREIVTCI